MRERKSPHGRILKFVFACLVLHASNEKYCCHSLKLNPVQPLPLLPLLNESASMVASFYEAKQLIRAIREEFQETRVEDGDFALTRLPPNDIRTSGAIKILSIVSNRWKSVERKYMSMVSSNMENATLFDESLNNLSVIKLLLANVYLDTNNTDLAIEEYETACPITMGLQSYQSYDSFEWIDCLSKLSKLYIKNRRYEDAVKLGESLVTRMPWLASLSKYSSSSSSSSIDDIDYASKDFEGDRRGDGIEAEKVSVGVESKEMKPEGVREEDEGKSELNVSNKNISSSKSFLSHSDEEIFSVVLRFSEFSKREKRMLAAEASKTWLMAERLRIDLREAVKEFTIREGKEELQRNTFHNADKFVKTMLHGYLELTPEQFDLNSYISKHVGTLDFSDLYPQPVDPTDLHNDSIEIFERIKDILFSYLKRECFLYLNTMKGILDKGRNYVPAAKIKAKEFESEGGGNRYISGPQGFYSIVDVLELFQYFQNEAKKHHETQKVNGHPSTSEHKIGANEKANFSGEPKVKRTTGSSATGSMNDDITHRKNTLSDPWDMLSSACNHWFYMFVGLVALLTSYGGQPNASKQRPNARYFKAVPSTTGEKEDGGESSKKSYISFLAQLCKSRYNNGVRNALCIYRFIMGICHAIVMALYTQLEPFFNIFMRKKIKPQDIDSENLLSNLNGDRKTAGCAPASNSPKKNATTQKKFEREEK